MTSADLPSNTSQNPPSGPDRPGRLGVGIVGAGRVGAVLGAALRAAGHSIVGVSAVSEASLERAQTLLHGVPVLAPAEIVERCELVLLAVPSTELPSLVEGLAQLDAWQQGQIVAHTSGEHGVGVLSPAASQGALGIALHPAMDFTGLSLDLNRLVGATVLVTGPAPFLPIAQALVVEMGAEPLAIDDTDFIAAGAALAAGRERLATAVRATMGDLADAGLKDDAARLAGPLLRARLDNALTQRERAQLPLWHEPEL